MSTIALNPLPPGRYVSTLSFDSITPAVGANKSVRKPPKKAGGRRFLRRAAAVLLAFTVIFTGLAQTSTKEASANPLINPIIEFFESMFPEAYGYKPSNPGNILIGTPFIHRDGVSPNEIETAYEKYGNSGASFTSYRGTPGSISRTNEELGTDRETDLEDDDPRRIVSAGFGTIAEMYLANSIFQTNKIVVGLTTWVYGLAFQPSWLNSINEAVHTVITGDQARTDADGNVVSTSGGSGSGGLRDALYLPFITIMIMIGALYLGWIGLVKRASLQAFHSFLWMLGAVLTGSLLMFNPSFLPNMANNIVSSVESAIISGTTSVALNASANDASDNFCYVSPTGSSGDDVAQRELVIRQMECSIWSTFIYVPWVSGQFGVDSSEAQDIAAGSGSQFDVTIGSNTFSENIALYQIEQQSLTYSDSNVSSIQKQINWFTIPDYLAESSPDNFAGWAAGDGGGRMGIAFLALFAAGFGMLAILIISMSMIVYGLLMSMLIFVSVLFLLVGAHPGMGRGIALRWAELVVETILKRIMAAALLGMLMAFFAVILNSDLGFGVSILALSALSIAGLGFRKTLTNAFSQVSFGGTNAGIDQGMSSGTKRGVGAVAMGALAGGAAVAGGGAVRAGRAAMRRPGATKMTGIAAATKAAGAATKSGVKSGAISGRMDGASALMASRSAKEAMRGSTAKGDAKAERKVAKANEQWQQGSPEAVAQRQKEREQRNARYMADYQKHQNNPEWRAQFQKAYGFVPPPPEDYSFYGYGVRPDAKTGALPPDLRPQYLHPPAPPAGGNTGTDGAGGDDDGNKGIGGDHRPRDPNAPTGTPIQGELNLPGVGENQGSDSNTAPISPAPAPSGTPPQGGSSGTSGQASAKPVGSGPSGDAAPRPRTVSPTPSPTPSGTPVQGGLEGSENWGTGQNAKPVDSGSSSGAAAPRPRPSAPQQPSSSQGASAPSPNSGNLPERPVSPRSAPSSTTQSNTSNATQSGQANVRGVKRQTRAQRAAEAESSRLKRDASEARRNKDYKKANELDKRAQGLTDEARGKDF